MKKTAIWFLCMGATITSACANGGGYFRGGVENAGDVTGFEPLETQNIRIVDEKLTIALGPKEADVEVRYIMRNETGKKVKVRFGFPVEELFDNDLSGEPDSAKPGNGKLKYCHDYTISAAEKSVTAKWQGEEKSFSDNRFKGIAGWLISEITFAPSEEKPVLIRFKSGYPSKEWYVSENNHITPSIFKYRLSTAACWAGTIAKGQIILKPDGISPDDLKVLKPVNRFKKDGANWVWNFEDLEPTLADDIEVIAVPEEKSYGNFTVRNGRWTTSHSNYEITASSTLPADGKNRYDASQLKEFWTDSAWSEGAEGPGIGEWLEIKPVVSKPLTSISLRPGYGKEALFKANARPKKILVELNGEHRFSVNVPDSNEVFEFPVLDYDKPVKTVRLTFEEIWKGNRFEDLCVSGLRLHVKLDKKPEIGPSR